MSKMASLDVVGVHPRVDCLPDGAQPTFESELSTAEMGVSTLAEVASNRLPRVDIRNDVDDNLLQSAVMMS